MNLTSLPTPGKASSQPPPEDALQLPVVGGAGCVQYLILMTIVMMIIIDYRHDDHLDNDYPHDGHHEVHDHDNAEQAPGLR